MKEKKLIFISSKQNELQAERNALRESINTKDSVLSNMFIAKTFETDLTGRKNPVNHITKEWVLKSDIYLGVFDKEYSEATQKEYEIALKDKQVKKEFIILIRQRDLDERTPELNKLLARILDLEHGHSCIFFNSVEELLDKVKQALLEYSTRNIEGFVISKKVLGPKLEGAKNTNFPEKLRRKLLQPVCRYAIWRGRKGVPEYYIYNWDGIKIDVTWNSIEPNASDEIKEFYRRRYKKPFDASE